MYFSGVYLLPWPDGSLSVLGLIPAAFETFGPGGSFRDQHIPDLPIAAPSAHAFSPATGSYFRLAKVPAVVGDTADMIQRCVIEPGVGSECGDFADPSSFLDTEAARNRGALAIPATAHGKLVVADEQTYQMWILDDTERRRSGNGHWGDGVLIQRRMARYSIVVSMIAISTRRLRPRAASVVSATSGIDLPIPCIVTMPASTPASTR